MAQGCRDPPAPLSPHEKLLLSSSLDWTIAAHRSGRGGALCAALSGGHSDGERLVSECIRYSVRPSFVLSAPCGGWPPWLSLAHIHACAAVVFLAYLTLRRPQALSRSVEGHKWSNASPAPLLLRQSGALCVMPGPQRSGDVMQCSVDRS